MKTFNSLETKTNIFFSLFWDENKIGKRPEWSKPWEFDGELPNNESKGCYAHFNEDELVYIGLGIGNSFDGSGIGARVRKYWKKNPNKSTSGKSYIHNTDKVITAIRTIPFPDEYFYFAAALEVFLITQLLPKNNKAHKNN